MYSDCNLIIIEKGTAIFFESGFKVSPKAVFFIPVLSIKVAIGFKNLIFSFFFMLINYQVPGKFGLSFPGIAFPCDP